VTSGTFHNTLNTLDPATYNPAFITSTPAAAEAALAAGLAANEAYLNIHTSSTQFPTFSGGEIRGFLQAVPEPASIVMLGIGVLGIVAYGCRRTLRPRV